MKVPKMDKVPAPLANAIKKANSIITEREYFIINYDAYNFIKKKFPLKNSCIIINRP